MVVRLKLVIAVLLLVSCASIPPPALTTPKATRDGALAVPIEDVIDAAIARPPFDHALWGILIEDEDGTVLFEQNAGKLMQPASTRKLFAAATVASCLGYSGQLHTEVFREGEDLILRGDGDPSLGSWRYERDGDFDQLASLLKSRGLTSVRDLVVDVSAFDRVILPGSWKHGNLGNVYAAPVDAIAWGENQLTVDRSTPDPALHAGNALRDALILGGVAVTGEVRVNVEPRTYSGERLAQLPSPFMGQLLEAVLKNSQNLYAEMLLKRSGDGTYPGALERERMLLTTGVELDGAEFRFLDGSGLSPDDLVTPRATVGMLRWMNDPVRRALWWPALAQPANNGTLRRRLVPLEGRLRGKTGSIAGVNALAGIIAMPDGRYRYFSIAANHHTGTSAIGVIDEIVERISQ